MARRRDRGVPHPRGGRGLDGEEGDDEDDDEDGGCGWEGVSDFFFVFPFSVLRFSFVSSSRFFRWFYFPFLVASFFRGGLEVNGARLWRGGPVDASVFLDARRSLSYPYLSLSFFYILLFIFQSFSFSFYLFIHFHLNHFHFHFHFNYPSYSWLGWTRVLLLCAICNMQFCASRRDSRKVGWLCNAAFALGSAIRRAVSRWRCGCRRVSQFRVFFGVGIGRSFR
jgi:hypothetical protein